MFYVRAQLRERDGKKAGQAGSGKPKSDEVQENENEIKNQLRCYTKRA